MPPEIVALIDKPHLLIAVLFVGAVIGMLVEQALADLKRRAWRRRSHGSWKQRNDVVPFPQALGHPAEQPPYRLADAANQLRVVMGAEFTAQPLLNKSEARVFRELDRIVAGCNPAWQVMAQVSLGEILRSADRDAYGCINSKRVDLLLVDEDCRPRHVVEYQGTKHHLGNAAARDAVKKEALRRAGIGYHEVIAGQMTPSELRRLIEKLILSKEAAARGFGQREASNMAPIRSSAVMPAPGE